MANGVLNCASELFPSVAGLPIVAIILACARTTDAVSPLMTYTDEGSGLPEAPSGSNITVFPDTGPFKLFEL